MMGTKRTGGGPGIPPLGSRMVLIDAPAYAKWDRDNRSGPRAVSGEAGYLAKVTGSASAAPTVYLVRKKAEVAGFKLTGRTGPAYVAVPLACVRHAPVDRRGRPSPGSLQSQLAAAVKQLYGARAARCAGGNLPRREPEIGVSHPMFGDDIVGTALRRRLAACRTIVAGVGDRVVVEKPRGRWSRLGQRSGPAVLRGDLAYVAGLLRRSSEAQLVRTPEDVVLFQRLGPYKVEHAVVPVKHLRIRPRLAAAPVSGWSPRLLQEARNPQAAILAAMSAECQALLLRQFRARPETVLQASPRGRGVDWNPAEEYADGLDPSMAYRLADGVDPRSPARIVLGTFVDPVSGMLCVHHPARGDVPVAALAEMPELGPTVVRKAYGKDNAWTCNAAAGTPLAKGEVPLAVEVNA